MHVIASSEIDSLDSLDSINESRIIRESIHYRDTVERIKRSKYRGLHRDSRINNAPILPGDTTNNKPATKIDAKVDSTLQREVNESDFTMRHEYDEETELAIFNIYRYKAVSRRSRKHTIKKKGGEDNNEE